MNQRLKGLAYRLLGCVADAEDVVQEAHLRLYSAKTMPISEEAYLYRVVSNLCVDRLRRQQTERKLYFGPWLPEPIYDTELDPVELSQGLDLAFMTVLDNLSPAERVVFVLRESFDFSFEEISHILEITTANARQRAHRAKVRLKSVELPDPVQLDDHRSMLQALAQCITTGDVAGLVALMSEEVVALTDGGGYVNAAIAPIYGPQRIAQVAVFLAKKSATEGALEFKFARVNGSWALIIYQQDKIHSCFSVGLKNGKVMSLYVMRNPYKLERLAS